MSVTTILGIHSKSPYSYHYPLKNLPGKNKRLKWKKGLSSLTHPKLGLMSPLDQSLKTEVGFSWIIHTQTPGYTAPKQKTKEEWLRIGTWKHQLHTVFSSTFKALSATKTHFNQFYSNNSYISFRKVPITSFLFFSQYWDSNPEYSHWNKSPNPFLIFVFGKGSHYDAKLPKLCSNLWSSCLYLPECWHYRHYFMNRIFTFIVGLLLRAQNLEVTKCYL